MTLIGGRYLLAEVIGTGGMSEVYAAQDTLIGRDVAVKMLRLELARDVNFRERFQREAANSGKLNHPAIVAVFDTGETTIEGIDVPYIVMERVHGRTIRQVILDEGPMSATRAAETLLPACAALQASHDAGIIHRDIKPANIMVTNTGDVKVMDFGIARALDDSTHAMTQTSAVIGTAQYLSPEQARGKAADGRSDIYALGCVLYEMVTGHPPFEGETPFAVAFQHVQENPTPPSELIDAPLSPTAALNLDAVVLTAMAKHPADRYQTATQFGEDLQKLARNAVTNAARSYVSPDDPAPTTVSAAVVPATTPAPAAVPAAGAHRREADTRGNRRLTWVAAVLALIAIGIGGAFVWDLVQTRNEQNLMAQMVTVPDLTGKSRDDAIAELEALQLVVNINEEPSPDKPRNEVLRTNPVSGSQLQRGTNITLTVSTGKEITDVPDLKGMTPQEAADALAKFDLQLEQQVREATSDEVEQGRIIEQNPTAGSPLPKGSKVSITVSTGAETTRVPVLSGLQLAQAEATLTSLDFVVQVRRIDSMEPDGQVIRAQHEGAEIPTGSTVVLEVSNGMLIPMPDLSRLDERQALAALRAAGWTGRDDQLITGADVSTGALVDQGRIASTNPSPGAGVRKDGTITARYWVFQLDALVPGN
ncbi:Serine/threonine-protein kinase PknB [Corynebacterium atrinae]|uniref:Stk1 family PASTA domain-containing Ser/Thr kinase n=1 Tax=Corynebacterium atrinae TaxID=1336740 RepID=UPI0025B537D0|nr:Stk1 family PASTA domain-containing Ser/Thr kinase [Corynebacterium atrinae]WJY62171.1 Serine/threonine-protein kinase PknB [Corynebacterium atrinae]